jgi:hypothetical protein
VRIQIAQVRGRPRIVGIQVQSADGVTHDAIRSVPVAQIEASLLEQEAEQRTVTLGFELPTGGWPPPKPHELRIADKNFENPDGRGQERRSLPPSPKRRSGRLRDHDDPIERASARARGPDFAPGSVFAAQLAWPVVPISHSLCGGEVKERERTLATFREHPLEEESFV